MTHLITLSTFWTGTLLGTWLAASSPHLLLDLFSLLLTRGGRTSRQARSSWTGSLKVSTSTSDLSRAEPAKFDVCAIVRENVQSFYLFSFGLISTYSIKHQTQK